MDNYNKYITEIRSLEVKVVERIRMPQGDGLCFFIDPSELTEDYLSAFRAQGFSVQKFWDLSHYGTDRNYYKRLLENLRIPAITDLLSLNVSQIKLQLTSAYVIINQLKSFEREFRDRDLTSYYGRDDYSQFDLKLYFLDSFLVKGVDQSFEGYTDGFVKALHHAWEAKWGEIHAFESVLQAAVNGTIIRGGTTFRWTRENGWKADSKVGDIHFRQPPIQGDAVSSENLTLLDIWLKDRELYNRVIEFLSEEYVSLGFPFVKKVDGKLKWRKFPCTIQYLAGFVKTCLDNNLIKDESAPILQKALSNTFNFNFNDEPLKTGKLLNLNSLYLDPFNNMPVK